MDDITDAREYAPDTPVDTIFLGRVAAQQWKFTAHQNPRIEPGTVKACAKVHVDGDIPEAKNFWTQVDYVVAALQRVYPYATVHLMIPPLREPEPEACADE